MSDENVKQQDELMLQAETKAREYFKEGFNCSECVFQTFIDMNDLNLPPEVIGLSTGFGGGIGRTRNICGAITGAVLSLSAIKGRKNLWGKETPKERAMELSPIYEPFADMIHEIEEQYGTLICSELSSPHGDFQGKERKKNCQQIIGYAASLATKYAAIEKDKHI